MAGRLPILLREIFASLLRKRLPAVAPYRKFISWLARSRPRRRPHGLGRGAGGFDTPTWSARHTGFELGARGVKSFAVSAETTHAVGELARTCHTP